VAESLGALLADELSTGAEVPESTGVLTAPPPPGTLPLGSVLAGAVAESVTLGTVPDRLDGALLLVEAGEFLLMMSRICCS
jgi:hypothetical protein